MVGDNLLVLSIRDPFRLCGGLGSGSVCGEQKSDALGLCPSYLFSPHNGTNTLWDFVLPDCS